MFHFLKPKSTLCDLIPDNYTDIHSHLLPGIDDGAKNIVDTKSLMKQMKDIGFKKIITTPHIITTVWNNTEESIRNKHNETLLALEDKTAVDSFHFAAEYMMDSYFLKKLATEKLLTLKDNYILVEMSYISPPIQLYDIIFEIQVAGYKPVLAHPERYLFYHSNFQEYEKLKKSGCLFQLNLLSTVGYYGESVTKIANKLLDNEVIDFVGSDIHHQKHIDGFYQKIKIKNQEGLKLAMTKNSFFS